LDLDSLRITVKHAPIGKLALESYSRTLQNRYTLKKDQLLNMDTSTSERNNYEKSWRSSKWFEGLQYGELQDSLRTSVLSEAGPQRTKQKENDFGIGVSKGSLLKNWLSTVEKNRLSHSVLQRQFKRKRVRRRRGRKLVAAGYSRRPNLSALIKRSNQNNSIDAPKVWPITSNPERMEEFSLQNIVFEPKNKLSPLFNQKSPYSRKRKHREWDRKVKPDNGIKTNKYRKRRISFYGKLRSAQKELIRVRWKLQVQKWWWQFMPSLRNAAAGRNNAGIGDRDYKPFGLPEAIRIRRELEESSSQPLFVRTSDKIRAQELVVEGSLVRGAEESSLTGEPTFFSNLTKNTLNTSNTSFNIGASEARRSQREFLHPFRIGGNNGGYTNQNNSLSLDFLPSAKLQITNSVPFYAGWDESMRKFVITNILNSLRDSTYEMKNIQTFFSSESVKPYGNVVFTQAPLSGQNGATTVYWQTPFSTYETDQFFTLGVDGFSPLQWSRFNFSQSIVKNWSAFRTTTPKAQSPILVKDLNIYKAFQVPQKDGDATPVAGTFKKDKITSDTYKLSFLKNVSFGKLRTSASLQSVARRRQKRYKRVRRHPRAPIWYPSGSLISDVLPTQYIYAFDSTARRPRDRFMQRRWRKQSQLLSSPSTKQVNQNVTDFTLRRRPNGRRKYHRRGGKLRSLLTVAYPKRRKFVGSATEELRWRPERSEKDLNYTIKLEDVRKRRGMALRRRKLRQVFPVIRRFKTLNGGFVWPGTYLLLEQRNVPKMNVTTNDIQKALRRSRRKKQRRKIKRKTRSIAQWTIQPKKYLLQKHNQKVLKKKLQKAYRTHNLAQKLEQLKTAVHTIG
jgi:hypothetical protein